VKVVRSSALESGLLARAWWLPDQLSTWAAWQARQASGSAVADGRGPDARGKGSSATAGAGASARASPWSGAAPGALGSHPAMARARQNSGAIRSADPVAGLFIDGAEGWTGDSWWSLSASLSGYCRFGGRGGGPSSRGDTPQGHGAPPWFAFQ